jgi:hypothetical protein
MQATWAQGSAVDKFQRTARMFELSGASDLAKQGADAALVQSLKVLHTSHPDIADRVIAVAQEELKQQLVRDLAPGGAFLVQLTESFDKRFSEEEIDALISFYESPVGRKLVAVQPTIVEENMQIGTAWGQKIAPELVRRIDRALAAQGIKFP